MYALSFNPDVICLTETCLTPKLNSQLYNIPGYYLVRNDRDLVHPHSNNYIRGGGVATDIKDSYESRILKISINMHINETEFIIFEVFPNNHPTDHILIAIAYRRPSGFYPTDFFIYLQEISHTFKHIIITGDLNADLTSPDNHTIAIQKLINESALFQIDLGITHTPTNPMFSPSSIDTFIVDLASKVFDKFTSSYPLA